MNMGEEHVVVDDSVIDSEDIFAIIDPLWSSVDTGHEEQYVEGLKRFSLPQQYVFAICWYRGEVNNGGHEQFYGNSAGIVWDEAAAGLDEVGAPELRAILDESAKRMGGRPSKNQKGRFEQLKALTPNFDDLDERFYELEGSNDFDSLLLDYVKKNRASFCFDGMVDKV